MLRGGRAVPVDTARDRDEAGTVPAEGDRHCPIDAHRLSRRIRSAAQSSSFLVRSVPSDDAPARALTVPEFRRRPSFEQRV